MLKRLLEEIPSLSALAFIWREKLGGDQFELLRKNWLRPLAERPRSHPCTRCNGIHRIIRHSDEDIVSVPPEDSYCKRQALSFEDVCLLRFDLSRFVDQLCQQLSISLDKKTDFSRFPCRIGWVEGAHRQYPVYLLLGDQFRAEQTAKNLLVEEDSPFVLISSSDFPVLFPLFKKQKCCLLSLLRIAGITSFCVETVMTGPELFAGFLRAAEGSVYVPAQGVQPLDDYARITFSEGEPIILSSATTRRSMVRFIHQWVQQSGNPVFDIEVIREAHNKKHSDRAWTSTRFREDLFKRNESDFDRLFETLDAAGGRYRIKF